MTGAVADYGHIKPRKTRAPFLEFCRYLRSLCFDAGRHGPALMATSDFRRVAMRSNHVSPVSIQGYPQAAVVGCGTAGSCSHGLPARAALMAVTPCTVSSPDSCGCGISGPECAGCARWQILLLQSALRHPATLDLPNHRRTRPRG
jgi:hypothetical protein